MYDKLLFWTQKSTQICKTAVWPAFPSTPTTPAEAQYRVLLLSRPDGRQGSGAMKIPVPDVYPEPIKTAMVQLVQY